MFPLYWETDCEQQVRLRKGWTEVQCICPHVPAELNLGQAEGIVGGRETNAPLAMGWSPRLDGRLDGRQ